MAIVDKTREPRRGVVTAAWHRCRAIWFHRRGFAEIVACRIRGRAVCLLVARDNAGSYCPAKGMSRLCLALGVRFHVVVVDFDTAGPLGLAGGRDSVQPGGKWWCRRLFEQASSRGGRPGWHLPHGTDWVYDPTTGSWWPGRCVAGVPRVAYPDERTVQHYTELGVPSRRDEYDTAGRVVRSVDLHPSTGRPVGHRYFDTNGICWLSTTLDSHGRSMGQLRQHQPSPVTHHSILSVQRSRLGDLLQELPRPRVLAIGPRARLLREHATVPERDTLS